MSRVGSCHQEKESYWRDHVAQQAAGDVSTRAYCFEHGLSQPSFFSWRRAIRKRDTERKPSSRVPGQLNDPVPLANHRRQTRAAGSTTAARLAKTPLTTSGKLGSSRGSGSPTRSDGAGLVALDLVYEAQSSSIVSPTAFLTTAFPTTAFPHQTLRRTVCRHSRKSPF